MTDNRGSALTFWLVIAAGIAVMVFGIIFVGRFDADITLTPSPLIDEPAPDVTIRYLDSADEFRLADYQGQIVVINFWASWCLNCRTEHEALNTAAAGYDDLGVSFIGVAYQDRESASKDFLAELGRGDPYTYGIDEGSRVAVEFGILGLPETFFIDREGIIRAKVSGPVSGALLAQTIEAIVLGEIVDPQITTDDVENR
ncbi:MAG: redoxin domain-containing protein [Acidimicrobiia bacterium]|nr:redoxin domain-containing protein [Acidimicrobiia bacterium]MDX2467245.1 redoxin domain-containing protein [Acidimicrobiia bacterium]